MWGYRWGRIGWDVGFAGIVAVTTDLLRRFIVVVAVVVISVEDVMNQFERSLVVLRGGNPMSCEATTPLYIEDSLYPQCQ